MIMNSVTALMTSRTAEGLLMITNSVTALMTSRTAEGAGRIAYDHQLLSLH